MKRAERAADRLPVRRIHGAPVGAVLEHAGVVAVLIMPLVHTAGALELDAEGAPRRARLAERGLMETLDLSGGAHSSVRTDRPARDPAAPGADP